MTVTTGRVRVVQVGGATALPRPDHIVVEEPLRVYVESDGARALLGATMRTPGHDLDLAVGLALGEAVIRSREDVVQVRPCHRDAGAVSVQVRPGLTLPSVARVGTPTSACGVCGRDAIEQVMASCPAVSSAAVVSAQLLVGLPDQMAAGQRVFRRTGGLHAAGVAAASGIVHTVREDVGRHNAVDKAIGAGLLADLPLDVLVVSGRAGFEIVQKAAMAGIWVVASVSAPTSLAVELAQRTGILLAGFVRDGRCNIYTGSDRLVDGS